MNDTHDHDEAVAMAYYAGTKSGAQGGVLENPVDGAIFQQELDQAKAKVKMHTAMIAIADCSGDGDEVINQQANVREWQEHVAYLKGRLSKNASTGVTQTP